MTTIRAALVAGVASFALGAFMFADDKPSAAPDRPAYLVAQRDGGGTGKSTASDAGWIGLMLEDGKDKGLVVSNVFPAGPAAFAGVRAGDVLVKIGDASPDSIAKAVAIIEKLTPHRSATITVRRDGKSVELTVNTGSLADFHERYVREMMRRDPRDPSFSDRHGVSDADMSVELVRRLFEQNQRLETTLHQVLTEVQALRAEVREKKK